jgi:hypothetical protein
MRAIAPSMCLIRRHVLPLYRSACALTSNRVHHANFKAIRRGALALRLVWAGLRIGWVRGPAPTIARLARLKALADLGSPVIEQALTARLLPSLASHAKAVERSHRECLDRMSALLAERLPQWQWRQPAGGRRCGSPCPAWTRKRSPRWRYGTGWRWCRARRRTQTAVTTTTCGCRSRSHPR